MLQIASHVIIPFNVKLWGYKTVEDSKIVKLLEFLSKIVRY